MNSRVIPRSLLTKAFPDNPRLTRELESVDDFLNDTSDRAERLRGLLDALSTEIASGKYQSAAAILEALAELPNRVGAVEIVAENQANIRPIDSEDPASLMTRGVAYTVLVGIAGKGTTAARPAGLPADAFAIYFDTTLAAAGKPIFWDGAQWLDALGAIV